MRSNSGAIASNARAIRSSIERRGLDAEGLIDPPRPRPVRDPHHRGR
jgi:hypothetical protein